MPTEAREGMVSRQLKLQVAVNYLTQMLDLNPGPLKEQEVLLTTEQSVQSTCIHFFKDRMST